MKYNATYTKECEVYPGEYTLLPETEALMKEVEIAGTGPGVQPLVNMEETSDCFKIEMIIPAAKREDIFIYTHDNILSIVILHKHCEELRRRLQIHEFDSACLERHILLPLNADTEFICAEYRQGILSMHIPKSQQPFQSGATRPIVIY